MTLFENWRNIDEFQVAAVLYISIFWKDFRNKKDFGFFKRSFKLKNSYRKQTITIH